MFCLISPALLVGFLLSALTALILFLKRRYKYWTSRGVAQIEPRWFLGNFHSRKTHVSTQVAEFYRTFKKRGVKFGGIYFFLKPVFLPVDQELIKRILVKDFDHFMDHAESRTSDHEPLTNHLLNLQGSKWQSMRKILTPTFTSGKMKMMFQTFVECTNGLKHILEEYDASKEAMDVKDVLRRFTTDIIGNCAFGIECNTLQNPDLDFRKYGNKIFENRPYLIFKFLLFRILPNSVLKFFNMKFMDRNVEGFFINVVKEVVEYRETNNISRKDFMHLLLQLKNRGELSDDDNIISTGKVLKPIFNMNNILANCYVFFAAGFETSSTTMTYSLYELAVHKDMQEKLRNEIVSVLKKHDNKLSYDAIQEMNYLDLIFKESLRRHPPVGILTRKVTKDYIVPGTNLVLEKGTSVQLSVEAIHMDEEFYPDPERFDPERFTEENKAKRPTMSWIPFGEGPRQCIGLRFGLLQSKVGLVTIIKDFEVSLNKKTPTPLVTDPDSFIISAALGGVWLNVTKIKH